MATKELKKRKKRSANSLKREIRDRLWATDDTKILWAVLKFIRKTVPELPELPDELQKKLEAGLRDIAEGRVISNEDFVKWAEQKLSEH